jgi:aerobic-type carbon monoxide dehydrogenase small subunit (CoxS/CutS family)
MLPLPDEIGWQAEINGSDFHTNIGSNAILLDVLRDQAGSLGTKRGCDMGTCGCCSVLIDGKPRLSCLMLAQEANGAAITTIEGLADGHHLHPIQETFTTYGGSQCGFCSPGFLVVISALLEENPKPSDAEIKTAIEGNLCRCTGYQQIVDSVRAASVILTSESETRDPTDAHSDPHPGLAVKPVTSPEVSEATELETSTSSPSTSSPSTSPPTTPTSSSSPSASPNSTPTPTSTPNTQERGE